MGQTSGKLEQLATWMKESACTVVLSGAGMSTESGIPDFRSSQGLWKDVNPMQVATVEALEENYNLFQNFYSQRIAGLRDCTPHRGHEILAQWERDGLVEGIVTQNVDGFHQLAGSQKVFELHGSIQTVRCQKCGYRDELSLFLAGELCPKCRGKIRPNVVLFGEMLPQVEWEKAMQLIIEADLLIVMGTSLQVAPVNQLPYLTDGKKVLINIEPTFADREFDLVIEGKVGEVLTEIAEFF